jgi:hypothetical protein
MESGDLEDRRAQIDEYDKGRRDGATSVRVAILEREVASMKEAITNGFKALGEQVELLTVAEKHTKSDWAKAWSLIAFLGAALYRVVSVLCLTVLVAHVSHTDPLSAFLRVVHGP